MTIQECYTKMGADYAPVLQRLGSERIVTKFALRFLEDKTFSGLCDAFQAVKTRYQQTVSAIRGIAG